MASRIDHLVLAGGDLAQLSDWFRRETGIEPTPGGPHPGLGTRNQLVSLGGCAYLELIGPDPDQPRPDAMRPFGIDGLSPEEFKLAAFAVGVDDIDDTVARLAATEALPGSIRDMSRTRPDGVELSWRLAVPTEERQQGIVPFLIQWGENTPHPSSTSVEGCRLRSLHLQHPESAFIEAALDELDLETSSTDVIEIHAGQPAVLSATIETPNGIVQL